MKPNPADEWLKQYFSTLSFEDYTLLDRAVRTLEANKDGKGYPDVFPWHPLNVIMPADGYFNGAWNWDCAFHAMGAAKWNPQLARDQILLFCRIQQEDGLYPDVMWRKNGALVTTASKPPVMPWAAWCVERQEHQDDFLREAYQSFRKNEAFWWGKRGGKELGLFHYDADSPDPETCEMYRRFESGWDDSPRWDDGIQHLFPVDLNCYMVLFYRAMAKMAAPAGHPEEQTLWQQREQDLTQKMEKTLWDEETHCYLDYNEEQQAFSTAISPASFMPLFIRTASPQRAEAMSKVAEEHFNPGWPSISYRHPTYDPFGYWRGRTWLNIAYFALKGLHNYGFDRLAEQGRETMLEWVRRNPGSIYENYNSQTGAPAGAPHFSWSAVFCIKFLLDWDQDDF